MIGFPKQKPLPPLQLNGKMLVGGAFLALLILGAVVFSLHTRMSSQEDRSVDPARAVIADRFMRTIERDDYAAAYAMLGPELQRNFTQATFQGTWERMLDKIGTPQLRSAPHSGEGSNPEMVVYTVLFESSPLDIRLTVSAAGKISDFAFDSPSQKVLAQLANQSSYVERETWIGDWLLPGRLTSPARVSQTPAIVLLPDAGRQDADQSAGDGKLFRDLAYALAARGIMVLRYQKRPPSGDTATIEDEYVDDAVAAIRQLRQIPGVDLARIYIAGYGMGGSVAPLVARHDQDVAGLILLAADARPREATLASRLASLQLSPGYWQELERYDPVATARDVGRPVLLIQGGRDPQVTPDSDLVRWESGLAGCHCATVKRYPELDHSLLVSVTNQDTDTTAKPTAQLPTTLVEDIAAWILPSRTE